MILLILFLCYPWVVGVLLLVLNHQCLLPGTRNYKQKQRLEVARAHAIEARYRARENEILDQHNQRQLEVG